MSSAAKGPDAISKAILLAPGAQKELQVPCHA
jgi:hypothetical protein